MYSSAFCRHRGARVLSSFSPGIDHDHCMFHDPHVPTPIMTTNFSHRKIVRYDHLPTARAPSPVVGTLSRLLSNKTIPL